MRADGRSDDDNVHRADCSERILEVGVQVDAVDRRWIEDNPGIDCRDELHSAVLCQLGDPFGMDSSIPANSDKDQACWAVARRGVHAHHDFLRGLENAFTKVHDGFIRGPAGLPPGALGAATEEDGPTWQAHPTLDRKLSPTLLLAQASHWPRFHE